MMRALLIASLLATPSLHTFGIPPGGTLTNVASASIDLGSQVVAINAAGQNVWVEVDGCTSRTLEGWTHSGCDFTAGADAAGTYEISYSISYSGGNGKFYETGISIDDVMQAGCYTERLLSAGGDLGNVAKPCTLSISAAEVVKIEMRGTDGATSDATVSNLTLVIHQI